MKTEVYVVSHKKAKMPNGDIYIPLQVGKNSEDFPGFLRDNTGNNIASKNENYCELTAQYWATKNRVADVKGLVHYRRLFSNGKKNFFSSVDKKFSDVMTAETLARLLSRYDLILPQKRNYYIETSWSHYEHIHHIKDLETTREVLAEKYPDYLPYFDKAMQARSAHMFNMLIAKSAIFDAYTSWLIDVLNEVEKRVDISGYTPYERRIYGFISELLLDVWVQKNQINYVEVPVMFMGKQNWPRKITSFLIRKVTGRPSKLD